MTIYEYQVKHWRFWKEFLLNYFAAIGLMSIPAVVWVVIDPDAFEGRWWIIAVMGVLALSWSVYTARYQVPVQDFRCCNTSIRLEVGDLFDHSSAHTVIGMASTFDVEINGGIVDRKGTQGQLLKRHYGGSTDAMDYAIDRALTASPVAPVGSVNKEDKKVYPVGTVAPISLPDGKTYFCLAYSNLDENNVAHGTIRGVIASLNSLWNECARADNRRPICIPLIGQGMDRIPDLGAELSVRLISLSYLLSSQRRSFSPELRIIVPPHAADLIDMPQFQAFLTSLEN